MNNWPRPTPLLLPRPCQSSPLAAGRSQPESEIVAGIGSREIRVAEFREGMTRRSVGDDPAAKEGLLEELVEFGALVEKARELGLDQDPGLRRAWTTSSTPVGERQFEPRPHQRRPHRGAGSGPLRDQPGGLHRAGAAARGDPLLRKTPPRASEEQQSRPRLRGNQPAKAT